MDYRELNTRISDWVTKRLETEKKDYTVLEWYLVKEKFKSYIFNDIVVNVFKGRPIEEVCEELLGDERLKDDYFNFILEGFEDIERSV